MGRRQARASLLKFTEFTNPLYQPAEHHKRICEKLEAVERGDVDRLMIFMPPRHGKSELASKRFPAWCLGRDPRRQIIAASYNSDLANDFGRNVRNIVGEPEFREVFPSVDLAPDSHAANRMNTNHGGAYVAAGVGTAVTGRGAHIALIDDPFKDREEADSERRRDLVWDWYRSTLFTRLMPGGSIVLIQTRWHEDDLAGRLLQSESDWDVLELPALDADGRALWPEWYDAQALERIKATIGPREWSALYQQKPQPDEGTFFQRGWFKHWEAKPELRYYGSSDYAVTDGGGDFTVHRVWGIDAAGALYRVDGWRGQATSDVWIERKLDLIAQYKPLAWFGEGGVIQKAIEPMLRRRMLERKVFCRMEWLPSVADKPTRARSFQAMAASGRVYFEDAADLAEFLSFPAGKHDDEVDVASLIECPLQIASRRLFSRCISTTPTTPMLAMRPAFADRRRRDRSTSRCTRPILAKREPQSPAKRLTPTMPALRWLARLPASPSPATR
jgi:predicted phage terminase large subunit-like protein